MEIEEYFYGAFSVFVLFVVLKLIFSVPEQENMAVEVFEQQEIFEYVPRHLISSDSYRLQQITDIADSVGYDWRSANANFIYGCPPGGCFCDDNSCLLGLIKWSLDTGPFNIWITPDAFQNNEDLKFAVLHEMAHVWQITTRGPDDKYEDFSRWDFGGVDPMEATADCLASAWGGVGYIYYDCPLDAQRYIHQLYLKSLR